MRLDYLSDLIEIERCQSISGAAQNLYLGQTTLSTILKNVEAEVGFKIFERLIGGVAPTPDGEAVLSLAKEICAIYECIQQIGQADRQSERTVTLLAAPSIICGLALPLNAILQRDHPYITLNLKETTGEEVGIRIIQNAANIGITYYSRKALEEFKPIAKNITFVSMYYFRINYAPCCRSNILWRQGIVLCHRIFRRSRLPCCLTF